MGCAHTHPYIYLHILNHELTLVPPGPWVYSFFLLFHICNSFSSNRNMAPIIPTQYIYLLLNPSVCNQSPSSAWLLPCLASIFAQIPVWLNLQPHHMTTLLSPEPAVHL